MPISLWQCLRIIRTRKVRLVIGIGGYTSPMMVLAAALSRVARVILEPNADAGMANKAVGSLAQRVFLAFESAAGSFDRAKVRIVGTPSGEPSWRRPPRGDRVRKSGRWHLLVFEEARGQGINVRVKSGDMLNRHPDRPSPSDWWPAPWRRRRISTSRNHRNRDAVYL